MSLLFGFISFSFTFHSLCYFYLIVDINYDYVLRYVLLLERKKQIKIKKEFKKINFLVKILAQ